MKTAQGKDLIFISRIKRDGSGVEPIVDQKDMEHVACHFFELNNLSFIYGTYIASAFNSYVVKIKS